MWKYLGPLLLVICGAAAIYWWPAEAPVEVSREQTPVAVLVAPVTRSEIADRLEALGTTVSNEHVIVTAEVTGSVRQIAFEDGQQISEGQLLVTLDASEEYAELAQAQAEYREQRREVERIRELVRNRTLPELDLDRRQSLLEQAQARIDQARARIDDHTIRAPFSGVLGLRQVSPGTLVTPGSPIVTLDDIRVLKLDFTVPERFLARLRQQDPIRASADAYPGETFSGQVETIAPRIDPVTRSVSVRARLPNPDSRLRPGMLFKVVLRYASRQALLIPEEALLSADRRHFVYLLDDQGRVAERAIRIGSRRTGQVEVLEGLGEGEQVITHGKLKIRPGQTVTIGQETWRQPQAPAGGGA